MMKLLAVKSWSQIQMVMLDAGNVRSAKTVFSPIIARIVKIAWIVVLQIKKIGHNNEIIKRKKNSCCAFVKKYLRTKVYAFVNLIFQTSVHSASTAGAAEKAGVVYIVPPVWNAETVSVF